MILIAKKSTKICFVFCFILQLERYFQKCKNPRTKVSFSFRISHIPARCSLINVSAESAHRITNIAVESLENWKIRARGDERN